MKAKTKKYPILTYLCLLLVVSILFTGVTFSRYNMSVSGNLNSPVAQFNCTYEIEDISTTSFPNVNYWLESGSAISTARTVRFTLKNYTDDGVSGVDVSGVDVNGKMRIYIPAEIADNLAVQISEISTDGLTSEYTPEIVLGELIYGTDVNNNKIYQSYNNSTVYTGNFKDYYDSKDEDGQYAVDETLSVNGSLAPNDNNAQRQLTAVSTTQGGSGLNITITANSVLTQYSVGFHRGKNETDFSPQLFLDLEKEVDFYTIDFTLPSMSFSAGVKAQKNYVLFMTLTQSIKGNEIEKEWSADYNKFLTPPEAGDNYVFEGAKVLGYHFEQPTTFVSSADDKEPEATTVRVSCMYDFAGGFDVSLYHVAPISEVSTASYVHPIKFDDNDDKYSVNYKPGEALNFGAETGSCSNDRKINIKDLYIDPLLDNNGTTYQIVKSLAKSYNMRLSALFVQASET